MGQVIRTCCEQNGQQSVTGLAAKKMHSIHPCIPHDWFCYWMHWWTTCTSQKVKIAQPSPSITHDWCCCWMHWREQRANRPKKMHCIHPRITHDWFCCWMHWWTTCTPQKVARTGSCACDTRWIAACWLQSPAQLRGQGTVLATGDGPLYAGCNLQDKKNKDIQLDTRSSQNAKHYATY